MRIRMILFVGLLASAYFLSLPSALAQPKNIGEVLKEKAEKGSTMKTRSFKKPDPAKTLEKNTTRDDGEETYEELPNQQASVPQDKSEPPEEDVWKKYQSIAAGSESKPLARRSYSMGKDKHQNMESNENSDNSENSEQEEVTKPKKKEKSKAGIGGVLEEYKNKKKKNASMHSRSLNE